MSASREGFTSEEQNQDYWTQKAKEEAKKRKSETGDRPWSINDIPDLSTMETPEVSYLMQNIIPSASMGIFTGESGSGKSSVLMSMAYAISVGEPWMGFKTSKTQVLYLDRENNLNTAKKRLERLHGKTGPNFLYWGNWVAAEEVYDLGSLKIYDWVQLQTVKPLIVVDSFIAFHDGSENDSAEVRRTFDMGRNLSALGATVIFIHHTGKAETAQKYRGSSDIKGSVDFAYKITSALNGMYLDRVEMECFKFRDEVIEKLSMCYQDGYFLPPEARDFKMPDSQKDMIEIIKSEPGISKNKFEKMAGEKGISKARASQFVQNSINRERIIAEKGPHGSQQLYWHDDPSLARQVDIYQDKETAELKQVA